MINWVNERSQQNSSLDDTPEGWPRWVDVFTRAGRQPFSYQEKTWRAYLAGRSGLVHAPTGSGKTLAVFGGAVIERLGSAQTIGRGRIKEQTDPFTLIWITPMRALASDIAHALAEAVAAAGLPWSVELRTSDTSASVRRRQKSRLPTVLVTTPESLSLLISYPESRMLLGGLKCAIVDEWHELLSTKRGVQTELGLARLRAWNPALRIWGLSATLENLDEAMRALCRTGAGGEFCTPEFHSSIASCRRTAATEPLLIHAGLSKRIEVDSLLPETIERFPWGGHMGLRMVDAVARAIDRTGSTLIFTNTRAQAETWFRSLLSRHPELLGLLAIHHGSLDRKIRFEVEKLLREGRIRAVVCTSSLDLGVDFSAVDQVLQIGSPKGIGRLMQRAGRSGHQPGKSSRVGCVPTHALELVEFSAARAGVERAAVEPRVSLRKPLDVLVQHLVTVAAGEGFFEKDLLREVRTTNAYQNLTDQEWTWVMDFVVRGGPTLTAYPRFARVRLDDAGIWRAASDRLAKMHRLTIGTITADGHVAIVLRSGKRLGTIEESFISKLKPGDVFTFAGRPLELLSIREMQARVRPAKSNRGSVPSWMGGRFPMSTQLAAFVRQRLDEARAGQFVDTEMRAIAPLLAVQARWSLIPAKGELLIESAHSRDGAHWFIFPFLGRLVHEGFGALLAHRLKRMIDQPVTATFTDYGIELLTHAPPRDTRSLELGETSWRELLSPDHLLEDLLTCLNAGELTKRQFREISRVAGLIVANTPGAPRSARQLQASSELFFEVFQQFDPQNLLLEQARREVLENQLEVMRLREALESLTSQSIRLCNCKRFTPLAFPIWAQRIQSQTVRAESAGERVERMMRSLEAAADSGK